MKRLILTLLAITCLLQGTGCKPSESPESLAHQRHIRRLQDENRQLKQERDASVGLLNISGFVLVIIGSALASALFTLKRPRINNTGRRR